MLSRLLAVPLMLVLATSLLGAGLPPELASAQQETPPPPGAETPPARLMVDGLLDAPRLSPTEDADAQDAPQVMLAPEYAGWSRLVFQTARNGKDWEVYGAAGDGSGQVNLSNNPSTDVHPRLNRGATRVVFASKRTGNYDVFAMNADGSGQTRLTTSGKDDVSPAWSSDGSRIAFQAYRDGQAEIYVMNVDGTGQKRLTNTSDYDGQPVWSPDGGQIAFVRKSSGQYRIWVMNADGSNARQLSNQAISENPAWSPDGSQIAYDADGNGDGWQELWLMDAAGGNQHQVYQPSEGNTDAWAGSWSPDGRYVAFTRISWTYYQNAWYWTTAYLDAWDSQNTWNVMRLSNNGVDWNPDWQPTDLQAPISSMQPLPAQSPGPFFVGWSGADIGPAGIATYDLQVRDGSAGMWTNWLMGTYNTPVYYPGRGGHTYYFRVRARDNAGNLEAWPADYDAVTTVESLPPVTAIQQLPAFTRGDTVLVKWDGSDPGGSGIQSYDVQVRQGSGAWTNWRIETTDTSATFNGAVGVEYGFRVRGRDLAQNLEAWRPGDGDAQTTFYRWAVSGKVQDNSGTPLQGSTITTSPASIRSFASTGDGSYAAYVGEVATSYIANTSKTGYGNLPETAFSGVEDVQIDLVLPPADNAVRNWGFEEGLLGTWEVGGEVAPTLAASARHTGQSGAVIGWADWPFTEPGNISQLPGYSPLWDAAGDKSGGVHVVWGETNPTGQYSLGLRYAQRTWNGVWSTPEVLTATPNSNYAQVALDSSGHACFVWTETVSSSSEILFRRRSPGGQWSDPENVSRTPATASHQPLILLDGNDVVHVIWREGYQVNYALRDSDGAWSTPVQISTNAGAYPLQQVAGAVSKKGEVTAAWIQDGYIVGVHRNQSGTWSPPEQLFRGERPHLSAGPGDIFHLLATTAGDHYPQISYVYRAPSGSWSAPETIVPHSVGTADMVVDGQGAVHVATGVWTANTWDELRYFRRSANGVWSASELIAQLYASPYAGPTGVDLDLDPNGTVFVIWRSGSNGYLWQNVNFVRRNVTGQWSSPREVSSNVNQIEESVGPLLVMDGRGHAHIVWGKENPPGYDIFHTLYAGTPTGDAWLRQQLTVPTSATNPGLSFLYQLHQDAPDGRNPFAIIIQDGASTSTAFSTSRVTTEWTHRWVNLASWLGRTITVTFNVQNAADTSPAMVDLDEVTVGSAHPDTWVRVAGQRAALPGGQLTQDLLYGNRGGVAASNGYVTLQLPPELTFVSADPAPSMTSPELRWDVGDLAGPSDPGAIRVTLQVAPAAVPLTTVMTTAAIASDTAEIEQVNNTARATLFIGYMAYLPVVWR